MRSAKKFLRKHPDLRGRFTILIDGLRDDPFQPHLKLHSLGGKLEGIFAVSITHSYQLTLTSIPFYATLQTQIIRSGDVHMLVITCQNTRLYKIYYCLF